MAANRKSLAKTKVLGIFYSGYLMGTLFGACLLFRFPGAEWVSAISFSVVMVLSFCIFPIRCESCGTLLYRKKYNYHGFPVSGWEHVDNTCPVCGIERYGFVDGVKSLWQRKKPSRYD
jgi:DNA-directed RNA polymerase subunit N (RpoN/RPB10)